MRKLRIGRQHAARFARLMPPVLGGACAGVAGWRIAEHWLGDGLVGTVVVLAAVFAWITWDLSR